jgi:CrcB protein
MEKLVLIALGSAVGGVLRYLVQGWLQAATGTTFPLGTLAVNLVGCFAIGFVNQALVGPLLVAQEYRLALTVGLLGGFTTFSAFGWETLQLLSDGEFGRALANVLVSVGVGLAAVWLGLRLAQRVYGAA